MAVEARAITLKQVILEAERNRVIGLIRAQTNKWCEQDFVKAAPGVGAFITGVFLDLQRLVWNVDDGQDGTEVVGYTVPSEPGAMES